MAKTSTSILFSGPYVAIHWRYNRRDFGKHCDTEKDWRACPIYKFGHSEPKKFSKLIAEKMDEENISEAYFAAPPDQKDFIEELIYELEQNGKVGKSGKDLTRVVNERYPDCEYFQKKLDDVISVTEQEVIKSNISDF